jgi:hypothetical protein
MRRDTRTVAVMGYGTPEEAAQEESLQETLSIIQDVAPTVQRLISGLPPAEQAAVLRTKIDQLRQYERIPGVSFFVKQRIAQYSARLAEVEKSAGYQRSIEMKKDLLYTLAIGLGVTFLVLYGAKTIKELRQE